MWWCTYGSDWQNCHVIDEFGGKVWPGYVCGPAANENLWAAMHRKLPTYDEIDAITTRDINAGIFDHGQTIHNVYTDYLQFWKWPVDHTILRDYNASGYNSGDIVTACQSIGSSQNGGVIVEVSEAFRLPFNESGVDYHFVCLLGYDSVAGKLLVGNADRIPLPHGTGRPDWYTVGELVAAVPCGILTIKGAATMGVPNGWTDDGTTLTAPNGHTVVGGFRQYLLGHTWDPGNLPLEEERAANPLEYGNVALGSGTQQCFQQSVLEWSNARGVFLAWCGQEWLAQRSMIIAAQKALKATYP